MNFNKIKLKKSSMENINKVKNNLKEFFINFSKQVKLNYIIFGIFCIFAIIFFCNAIVNTVTVAQFNSKVEGYKKTTGVLDSVNTSQIDDEIIYEKNFVYTVDNKTYSKRVEIEDANDYKLNETITIYYKLNNPSKSEVNDKPFALFIALIFYVLFLVDVIFMLFYFRLRVKKQKTPQAQLQQLDENFDKLISNIENSKDNLFKRNKKEPNKEKFIMKEENVYDLKIKDINGNIVGQVQDGDKSPSMAEATIINTDNIKKQIDEKLQSKGMIDINDNKV